MEDEALKKAQAYLDTLGFPYVVVLLDERANEGNGEAAVVWSATVDAHRAIEALKPIVIYFEREWAHGRRPEVG